MRINIFSSEPHFNAQRRLLVYKELLNVVCKDPRTHLGFCYYVTELDSFYSVYNNSNYWQTEDLIRYELPELYALKPKKTWSINSNYWYATNHPGWDRRISKLHKMIKKMEKDLQNHK